MCSVCQFLWYNQSRCGPFQAINLTSLKKAELGKDEHIRHLGANGASSSTPSCPLSFKYFLACCLHFIFWRLFFPLLFNNVLLLTFEKYTLFLTSSVMLKYHVGVNTMYIIYVYFFQYNFCFFFCWSSYWNFLWYKYKLI